jgi:peptide/nickel transport system substrate-binding protein
MLKLSRIHWIGLVAVLLLTGLFTGAAVSQQAVKNPGVMVVATIGEPESVDPAWLYETAGAEIVQNVYETLVFFKKDSVLDFVPMLSTNVPSAKDGTISADGLTYTFHIRQGVKFHNGDPLTPADVVYSFKRGFIQDRLDGPQWITMSTILGAYTFDEWVEMNGNDDVKACQALDKYFEIKGNDVIIHLAQPAAYFLAELVFSSAAVLDKKWVIEQGGWDGDCANWRPWHDPAEEADELYAKANGTGPFMLERWDIGSQIVLDRNPNYWNTSPWWEGGPAGPATLEKVFIKKIEEWPTRLLLLQQGDTDFAVVPRQFLDQVLPLIKEEYTGGLPDPANLTILNPNGNLRVFKDIPTLQIDAAFFVYNINEASPHIGNGQLGEAGIPADFFSDVHVRKGFLYSFDWDVLLDQVWKGEAKQPESVIPQGVPFYNPNIPTYHLDLEEAANEFKQAWGGQVWEKGFKFTFVYNSGNDQRKSAGEILKQNVESINPKFHVDIVASDWPKFLQDRTAGMLPVLFVGWLEDYHDANDWVDPFMSSSGALSRAQGENYRAYASANWDPKIRGAAVSTDNATRQQLYDELTTDYYNQGPGILLEQPLGRHFEQLWDKGWYYNPVYPGNYYYPLSK